MSFLYKDFELLKKQAAANNKKGVVGNKGTKIPMTPNVNDNNPNIVNIIFIFLVVKVQSSKFKAQSSKFRVQSSKFKIKSSSRSISRTSYICSIISRAILRKGVLQSKPIVLYQ